MVAEVDAGSELTLALETSGDTCSAAVLRGGVLISEHIFRHGMHLSERLLDDVAAILRDAEAQPEDVSLLAVGVGPGSFTGTRIGVMTFKTFASYLATPVYGIDSLFAMARAYIDMHDTLVVPMHPCRAGVVYTGLYRCTDGDLETIAAPDALPVADAVDVARATHAGALVFCGPASVKYRSEIESAIGEDAVRSRFGGVMHARAADVAAIALGKRSSGVAPDDPLALTPHYVSPPPITLPRSGPFAAPASPVPEYRG